MNIITKLAAIAVIFNLQYAHSARLAEEPELGEFRAPNAEENIERFIRLNIGGNIEIFNVLELGEIGVGPEWEIPIEFATQPITALPAINHLPTLDERMIYNGTWNTNMTQAANQVAIVNRFIGTCLNFDDMDLENNEGLNDENGEESDDSSIDGLSDSESDASSINEQREDENVAEHEQPLEEIHQHVMVQLGAGNQGQMHDILTRISQTRVGCELLRTLIAKYQHIHNINNNDLVRLHIRTMLGVNEPYSCQLDFGMYSCHHNDWNGLLLIPEITPPGVDVPMISRNGNGGYHKIVQPFPLDAVFFHQFSHVLASGENLSNRNTEMTSARIEHRILIQTPNGREIIQSTRRRGIDVVNEPFMAPHQVPEAILFARDHDGAVPGLVFIDDEEYRISFGVSIDGFSILNEASYMLERYGHIRLRSYLSFTRLSAGDDPLFYFSPNINGRIPDFGRMLQIDGQD